VDIDSRSYIVRSDLQLSLVPRSLLRVVWCLIFLVRFQLHAVCPFHVPLKEVLAYESRRRIRAKMAGKWSDSGVTEFMTFTLILSQKTRGAAKETEFRISKIKD